MRTNTGRPIYKSYRCTTVPARLTLGAVCATILISALIHHEGTALFGQDATFVGKLPDKTAAVVEIGNFAAIKRQLEAEFATDLETAWQLLAADPFPLAPTSVAIEIADRFRRTGVLLDDVERCYFVLHDFENSMPNMSLLLQLPNIELAESISASIAETAVPIRNLVAAPEEKAGSNTESSSPTAEEGVKQYAATLRSLDSVAKTWQAKAITIDAKHFVLVTNCDIIESQVLDSSQANGRKLLNSRRYKTFQLFCHRSAADHSDIRVYAEPASFRPYFSDLEDAQWDAMQVSQLPVLAAVVKLRFLPKPSLILRGLMTTTSTAEGIGGEWACFEPLSELPPIFGRPDRIHAVGFGANKGRYMELQQKYYSQAYGLNSYETAINNMYGSNDAAMMKSLKNSDNARYQVRLQTDRPAPQTLSFSRIQDEQAMLNAVAGRVAQENKRRSNLTTGLEKSQFEDAIVWDYPNPQELPKNYPIFAIADGWFIEGPREVVLEQLRFLNEQNEPVVDLMELFPTDMREEARAFRPSMLTKFSSQYNRFLARGELMRRLGEKYPYPRDEETTRLFQQVAFGDDFEFTIASRRDRMAYVQHRFHDLLRKRFGNQFRLFRMNNGNYEFLWLLTE